MKKFDQVCSVALNVFANKPGGSVNILINCSKTIDRRPNFRRCALPEGGWEGGGSKLNELVENKPPFEKRRAKLKFIAVIRELEIIRDIETFSKCLASWKFGEFDVFAISNTQSVTITS